MVALFFSSDQDDSNYGLSLWDCIRFVNILVLLRLLRIIPNIKPMALVTGVTLEIMRSLKSFAGIIIIIYYIFAILGMMLFEQRIDPPSGGIFFLSCCEVSFTSKNSFLEYCFTNHSFPTNFFKSCRLY